LYAGALVQALGESHANREDGSIAMESLFTQVGGNLVTYLSQAAHAKRLQNHGIEGDIDFCLSLNLYDQVVGVSKNGELRIV
jgi:2-phosphosulfolactate phosphatase